jgi:hypothetical protein
MGSVYDIAKDTLALFYFVKASRRSNYDNHNQSTA